MVDVAGLTVAMNQLLGDAPLRQRMGQAGRQRVLDEFSIGSMCEGNLAIYRKVLAT